MPKKKTIFEIRFGKGRGIRKVLVNTKRNAESMKKSIVGSGLFKASEFKITPITVAGGNGISKRLSGLLKKVRKKKKTTKRTHYKRKTIKKKRK